ncbi:NAD-dependent succinate-semialdehyde dehydrogenase [Ahrensia kielensis]|uniref:NAD-dependent succinate-semialdehyde dehydrogenase n=1 Tax=Ahrensia kielensis TaxID=76980 RepID=A0ABU9T5U7_9HYPH
MSTGNQFLREENYINGAWLAADSEQTIAVNNPATGATIGTVPNCSTAETERAIDAAAEAFKTWRKTTALERANILLKMHDLVLENQEALAQLLTMEQGKPIAEARAEVGGSAAYLRWFAEEGRRVYGDLVPSPIASRRLMVMKEPVGVVAAITPWNFPSSMIPRKLGPALAAGCTIIIKPSEFTPYSGIAWGLIAEQAGVPAGVVNILTGDAAAIGKALCASEAVRKISFTGSTRVGKILLSQSADTVKKVSMELGGNAPFIVFDDADIDAAITGAIAAKFRNAGQTCVCTNRFYVQAGIYDSFVKKLTEAAGAMKVGEGNEDGVVQGPLINDAALAKVEELVGDAVEKGGDITVGGKRHELGQTFFQPTVIANATQNMRFSKEEIFGPVAPVFKFEKEEEAVAMANDTIFGLASFVYTQNLGRAWRMMEELKYGLVGINEGVIATPEAPFGGLKQSGLGKEGGHQGIDDYLDVKYVAVGGLGM